MCNLSHLGPSNMLGHRRDVAITKHLQIRAYHPRQAGSGLGPAAPAAVRRLARVVVFFEMAEPPVRIRGDGEMLRSDTASTASQRQRADDGADRRAEYAGVDQFTGEQPSWIALSTSHDLATRNRNQIRRG